MSHVRNFEVLTYVQSDWISIYVTNNQLSIEETQHLIISLQNAVDKKLKDKEMLHAQNINYEMQRKIKD